MWTADATLRFLVGTLNKLKKDGTAFSNNVIYPEVYKLFYTLFCLYSSLSSVLYCVCMMWREKRGCMHAGALVWGSGHNYMKLESWFALRVPGIELWADFWGKCLYFLNHLTGLFEFYISINYIEAYKIFTSNMASYCQVRVFRT